MTVKKKFCPDCETMRPLHGFVNHSRICYKHPGNDWLHKQYIDKRRSMKAMACDIPLGSVSDDTVAKWLDAAGIVRRKYTKGAGKAKKPPVVVSLPAPVQGMSRCAGCHSLEYCNGLESWQPVGCEGLLNWELELAGVEPG